MHPEQIKAAMRMKGITCAVIADDLGVSGSMVSRVISRETTSARVAKRIAQVVGKPVEELFPPTGKPRLVRRRKQLAMVGGV